MDAKTITTSPTDGEAAAAVRQAAKKKALSSAKAALPLGPYSQGIAAGNFIFVAGEKGIDPKTEQLVPGGIAAETRQTLENIKAALEAAGASLSDLVRTNTYVTDIDEYFKHTDVRMEYYSHAMPTSTTVEVRRLAQPELMVEIDAIAAVG